MPSKISAKMAAIKAAAPSAEEGEVIVPDEILDQADSQTDTDDAQTDDNTMPKATPAPARQSSAARTVERRNQATEAKLAYGQMRQDNGDYAEAGCFYAAASPVANSVGGEVGFHTRDDKTGEVYRSGIGLYLRSDHLCKLPFIGEVDI